MLVPNRPDPQTYERIAAAFVAENEAHGSHVSCKMNAQIEGTISRTSRQIDLLIDATLPSGSRSRIIVDAKRYGRPLDIGEVEALEAMMRDCQADRGILVCPHGWSAAAERRAQQSITVSLLREEDVRDRSHWAVLDECYGLCYALSKPDKRGLVLWDQERVFDLDGLYAIVWTGKCDRCHRFQIWCWDCGGKYSLGIETELECDCARTWFTLVEMEVDDRGVERRNAILLLADFPEGRAVLDRLSLR